MSRWRPLRAGLLNVWQYTDEVLEFECGKMVLFGPNGSGKTMALELLLPYLLDANGQPSRLSTSGSDRGGLWDRITGYDAGRGRTGYLWIEFGRKNSATFTAGVRLRARPSGGGDKHWFTTSQRIGHDFELLRDGHPLSVEQLRAALEPTGTLWGNQTAGYREAVRTTLFTGWSEDRLSSLIDTLLVLRKQNVSDGLATSRGSKRTNLSDLLSQALPPLDDLELGRVADGFADLDRRRDRIVELEHDVTATRSLTAAHRTYARAVTARVARSVTQATSAVDQVTRNLKSREDTLREATIRRDGLRQDERRLADEAEALRGESEGITNSEAFREGAQLDQLRQAAESAERAARDATTAAKSSDLAAQRADQEAQTARTQEANARRQLAQIRQALDVNIERLGGSTTSTADGAVEGVVRAWLAQRDTSVRDMAQRHSNLHTANELLARSDARLMESEGRLSQAEQDRRHAERTWVAETKKWRTRVGTWAKQAQELGPHFDHDIANEPPQGWRDALAHANDDARTPLLELRAEHNLACQGAKTHLHALTTELELLRAQQELEPVAPPTRRDRTREKGAPLWRVLDFKEPTPQPVRAAIESALEQCGMLDAWLAPTGELELGSAGADIVLRSSSFAPTAGTGLLAVLCADQSQDRVARGVIERLLSLVELVEDNAHLEPAPNTGLVLGRDGTWRTIHRAGRAEVRRAAYIGASARAAERAARLHELGKRCAAAKVTLEHAELELRTTALRLRRCDEEQTSFPSPDTLDKHREQLSIADSEVQLCMEAHEGAKQRQLADAETSTQVERALRDAAVEYQLPSGRRELDDYAQGLRTTDLQLGKFKERRDTTAGAIRLTEERTAQARRWGVQAAGNQHTAEQRERDAIWARNLYAATSEAHGSTYDALLERKAKIDHRQGAIRRELKDTSRHHKQVERELGRVTAELAETQTLRAAAELDRSDASTGFQQLCRELVVAATEIGVAPEADLLTSVTATLEAARHVRSVRILGEPVSSHRELALHNAVMGKLATATRQLAGRAELTFEPSEPGWSVLRVQRDGVVTPVHELAGALGSDLQLARDELSRKEQALFEDILAGSVREHLKDRLFSAKDLVDRINELLGRVESASGGVRVELLWEIDSDLPEAAELRRAKELLLHDSPIQPDRTDLDAFLRQRIERVRSDDADTGDWRDRLTAMLDYRDWHRFDVLVHHKRFGDRPQRLHSRKVSLSAGEKTIVMILPLLAAVTAHYEPPRGDPPCTCPRLLLMDELFPKLDFPNKRQLMGLLTSLDLDCVFTSDKDRCEYDTMDGIAIIVFCKHANDKTTTTRLVWNGAQLETEAPAPVPKPPTASPRRAVP